MENRTVHNDAYKGRLWTLHYPSTEWSGHTPTNHIIFLSLTQVDGKFNGAGQTSLFMIIIF